MLSLVSGNEIASGAWNSGANAAPNELKKIACFGDSWAAFACDTLSEVVHLHLKENQVENKGVSGSTAAFWVAHMDDWFDLLVSAQPLDSIWLSLGGDDILGYYSNKNMPTENQTAIINSWILRDMHKLLNATFAVYPELQVSANYPSA